MTRRRARLAATLARAARARWRRAAAGSASDCVPDARGRPRGAAAATPRADAAAAAAPPPAAACAAAAALAPRATRRTASTAPRAFALLREQVEDYGWRPAGSRRAAPPRGAAARAHAARALRDVPGHPGLRNVVGSCPGRRPAIVVGAHYDVEARAAGLRRRQRRRRRHGRRRHAGARASRARRARATRARCASCSSTARRSPPAASRSSRAALRGSKAYAKRHAGADAGARPARLHRREARA